MDPEIRELLSETMQGVQALSTAWKERAENGAVSKETQTRLIRELGGVLREVGELMETVGLVDPPEPTAHLPEVPG